MADINFLSKEGLDRYDNNMKNYIGIELTKAEYDQLSEEEKNKGTYWITDYSSSGGSSNIELDKTLSIEGKAADAQAVGKALGKKITLADYLALPEEEQKTGVYWIEDANESLGDGSRFLKTTDVVDNFDSSDPTLPLSANMGKELKNNLPIIEKDGNWTVYKYPDGNFIAVLAWTTGNTISLSTAYGSLFISTVFSLAVPQNTRTIIKVSGNTTYLGGGIGGVSVSDNRDSIANHDDIKFFIWSATNHTARVDASFMCFGEWK